MASGESSPASRASSTSSSGSSSSIVSAVMVASLQLRDRLARHSRSAPRERAWVPSVLFSEPSSRTEFILRPLEDVGRDEPDGGVVSRCERARHRRRGGPRRATALANGWARHPQERMAEPGRSRVHGRVARALRAHPFQQTDRGARNRAFDTKPGRRCRGSRAPSRLHSMLGIGSQGAERRSPAWSARNCSRVRGAFPVTR